MPSAARPIVFLSDFGPGNEWVGICHSVLSRISRQSPIVDLSHLIRPLEVSSGALLLADSMRYLADDAVILAVVDPNVGMDREVAVRTASGRDLVGPDNGLLSLGWEAAGGALSAFEITSPAVISSPVTESFRAPDVLCPAAAYLAAGMAIEDVGSPVDPGSLTVLSVSEPEIEHGRISCEVIDFDRFGNVRLNVRSADLAAAGLEDVGVLGIETTSGYTTAKRGATFADFGVGEYGAIVDQRGWLTIVRNSASAITGLGLALAAPMWITAPTGSG